MFTNAPNLAMFTTTGMLGPDLGGRRVEDQFDLPLGLGDLCVVGARDGHDADHAVVVDGDVGAGLTLDGVDDLALRADDLTDLVDQDLEADDLRGGFLNFLTDGLEHDVEDVETGLTGLRQRTGEHVGGNAGDLGVELQGGDEVGGTGDLEVHVAERILGPRMSVRVTYSPSACTRPMAIPATGALIGTPASISDRVEPQTEPIEDEPFEAMTSETVRTV